jgi:hypothetical protein
MKEFLAAAMLLIAAQTATAYAQTPSYATQNTSGDQQIQGRVVSYNGHYELAVRDDHGYIDHVRLHDGTVIDPTGLTLADGMVVTVLGYNAGSYFAANEIDTPYTLDDDVPYYLGYPWWDYGPSYGLDYYFGGVDRYRGGAFYGHYHYAPRGIGIYPHGHAGFAPHVEGGFHGGHFGGGHFGGGHFGGGHVGHA